MSFYLVFGSILPSLPLCYQSILRRRSFTFDTRTVVGYYSLPRSDSLQSSPFCAICYQSEFFQPYRCVFTCDTPMASPPALYYQPLVSSECESFCVSFKLYNRYAQHFAVSSPDVRVNAAYAHMNPSGRPNSDVPTSVQTVQTLATVTA